MNLAWYLFYGRKLNMGRQEILHTRYGEMLDMISCLSIYEGSAKPARETITDVQRVLEMR